MYGYEYLKNFLEEEGYKIKDEEENHFSFKYQGTLYVAFKNDLPFLQIVIMCEASRYDSEKLMRVCNMMNGNKFVIKFVYVPPSVWVSYEFAPNYTTTNEDFQRILDVLNRSSDELFDALNSEED